MKIARIVAVAAIAGLISMTAAVPAHARIDTSWGYIGGNGR